MSEGDIRGVLRWQEDQERLVVEAGRRYKVKRDRDLHEDLRDIPFPQLDGVRVELRIHKGHPRYIRPIGTTMHLKTPRRKPADPDAFHNPYTFVPAPSRDGYSGDLSDLAKVADRTGAGHHRAHPDRWHGRLTVRMTVHTPLLLLDTVRGEQDTDTGHRTYPVLRRTGKPHVPPTAVKGMLRAAFEAITNSRFGVFEAHDRRLGARMKTQAAQGMVPARVSDDGAEIMLLPGDTPLGCQTTRNPLLHAAWLPCYGNAPRPAMPDGYELQHGDRVHATVELFQHHRWTRKTQDHQPDFSLWRVRAVAPVGQPVPDVTRSEPTERRHGRSWYEPMTGTSLKQIAGFVVITGQNIGRKHDERIFFTDTQPVQRVPLTDKLARQWNDVIGDYRAAHGDAEIVGRRSGGEVVGPDVYLGDKPGQTAWSPHLYEDDRTKLRPGQLVYAELGEGVGGLYPVMISRRLYPISPEDLLPKSLRPATELDDLSPADRVFGWVNGRGDGALRGHLRIGTVDIPPGAGAVDDDPAQFGEQGVPLAILGQPKPTQPRFYLAAETGKPECPIPVGAGGDGGYSDGRGLRGRKVYPHHAGLPDQYWDRPIEDRTQTLAESRYQEYRRPRGGSSDGALKDHGTAFQTPGGEQRDSQNRSIRGWIKPGTEMTFTMEVTNLTDIELGAMVWLLRLPPDHYHRLGLGKPLGFGSVRLDLDDELTTLCRGSEWAAYYRSLSPYPHPAACDPTELQQLADGFGETMPDRDVVLAAFLAAAAGDQNTPVHYPRVRPSGMGDSVPVPPDPRGRSYEWFGENERPDEHSRGAGRRAGPSASSRKRSLPPAGGQPLRIYEKRSRS